MIEKRSAAEYSPDTTHHYARVDWVEPNSITVLESSQGFPLLKTKSTFRIEDLVHQDHIELVSNFYNSTSKGTTQVEFEIHDEIGKAIPVLCTNIHDETGLKSIWQIHESEKQNNFKVLSVAAHDLRSPINSIIGLANVMQVILRDEKPDLSELGKMIQLIKTTGNSAIDFTSDIMELSEMESGHYQLETKEVSANQFLAHFIDTHRLATLKKGLKVEIETQLQPEDTFMINESKVTRVLSNVLSNATKFSNQGGRIIFKIFKKNQNIVIQLIDEGIGMSQAIIDTLFDKFGKSKRLGLEGEKSHGLGMSIIKQIMELHGGEIDIESEEGKGTTVSLIFKIKK